MTYAWTHLRETDTPAWSELLRVIAEHDGTEEFYAAEDLAEELTDPQLDPVRDTVAVRDPSGVLVAYGQLHHRAALVDGAVRTGVAGGVHPEHRGRGVGRELLRRLEQRALEAAADRPESPVVGRCDAGAQVADHRRLLERCGYRGVRFFHEMRHDLVDPTPVRARGIVGYHERFAAAVLAAHNAAFADHWASAPLSEREWRSEGPGSRTFRPTASFVLPGPDGRVDGYVLSYQWTPGELWIGQLGVRREARGRGVGRGLLEAVLAAARPSGFAEVGLSVDSESPTGAGRLYASAGFAVVRTFVTYRRTLRDGCARDDLTGCDG